MSKNSSLSLAIVFLAIAVFVSGSLVVTLRTAHGVGDGSAQQAIEAMQKA